MTYFTKNDAGEFVEVADDTILATVDVTKHPEYIKAAGRIGELNKESEKHRKRAKALEDALKADEPDKGETPDKPDAKPEPVAIDVEALRREIAREVLDSLNTAEKQARDADKAIDALLVTHGLPKSLKPALQAAGSMDAATVLAKQLGEAKLVFPDISGGNSAGDHGSVSGDALKRLEKDLYGLKD